MRMEITTKISGKCPYLKVSPLCSEPIDPGDPIGNLIDEPL
jgi:hypothetical protein